MIHHRARRIRAAALLLSAALCGGLLPAAEAAEGQTVTVGSAGELKALAERCALDAYSQDLTVVLTADLDLSGSRFSPIPVFLGNFDGAGHTIRGLVVAGRGSEQGLFRRLEAGALVENLVLEGIVEPGGSRCAVGILAGENRGTIQNCTVSGRAAGDQDVGGLVGINGETGEIRNCVNEAEVTGSLRTGGIAGRSEGRIAACTNRGSVNTGGGDARDMGGIAGYSTGTLEGCVNCGAIGGPHTGYNVGGIAGRQSGAVVGCENSGSIQARKDAGGIVGQFEPDTQIAYGEDPLDRLNDELAVLSGLLTRLSGQTNGFAGDAAADFRAVTGAAAQIRASAASAGDTGLEIAGDTLDRVYDSAQTINETAGAMTDRLADYSAQANQDLEEILDRIAELRATAGEGAGELDGDLGDARARVSRHCARMEENAAQIGDALDQIAGDLARLQRDAAAIRSTIRSPELRLREKLSTVRGLLQDMRAVEFNSAVRRIEDGSQAFRQETADLRRDLGEDLDSLDETSGAAWAAMDDAARRLEEAGGRLNSHTGGFSGGIAADLARVNEEIGAVEDIVRDWTGGAGDRLDAAAGDIGDQLTLIEDRLDALADGADQANQDLHATTGALLSQLDRVRSALAELGEAPEKTIEDGSALAGAAGMGRVVSCTNSGTVEADANAGGIAGIVSPELELDPEEDLSLEEDTLLVDTVATLTAVIRDCRSSGPVKVKNDCAGGILGRAELGAVLDCVVTAPVEIENGNWCGGVAGLSRGLISGCAVQSDLTGRDDVGGIAGEGRDLTGCLAMVRIFSPDGERLGAVAGSAAGEVSGNRFLKEDLAGMDGADYAGKAAPLDFAAFSAQADLPPEFLDLTVTFRADGEILAVCPVSYGGNLDEREIPAVPGRAGVYGAWAPFSAQNIRRSLVVEAVYEDLTAVLDTGGDRPAALVQGSFSPGAVLTAEPWTPAVPLPQGWTLEAGYTLAVDGGAEGPLTFRLRAGETSQIYLLADGALIRAETVRDGSCLVFQADNGVHAAVLCPAGSGPLSLLLPLSGCAAVLAVLLVLRHRQKRRPAPPAAKEEPISAAEK